jgi:lysophospholipase L1-like esterase
VSENFTDFLQNDMSSITDEDYLVGYKADGSQEWRAKRKEVLNHTVATHKHSYITAVESISQANTGTTFRAAHAFRGKPMAARLVFYNNLTTPVTFAQTGAATMRQVSTSLSPAASTEWTAGGAVTVPAAQNTNQPSIAFGPWIPVYPQESADDSGTYLVTVFAYLDSTYANCTVNSYDLSWMESETKLSGGYWAQRNQAGDQATNPGTFSSTTVQNRGPIAGIEILSENAGAINVMLGGDSIAAGAGQTLLGKTDVYRAVQAVNNLGGRSIGYIAAGWGGQNSATYLARMLYLLPLVKPDVLIVTTGTPNDGVPSLSGQRANRFLLAQVIDLAKSLGVKVLLRGWAPHSVVADNWPQGTLTTTPTYPVATVNGDVYRQDQNARCAAMDGQGNITYTPGISVLGDGAQPERYQAQYTTDLNHPNDAGYAFASINMTTAIQRLLSNFR